MSRTLIAVVAVLVLLLLLPLAGTYLIKEQAQVAAVGTTTPLHTAAAAGDYGKVMQLIKEGADLKAVDENGRTPLHLAAENGHGQTCKALLDAGVDANAVDRSGKRALDYAQANGHGLTADIIASASPQDDTQRLNPSLKYPDLPSFEAAIGQPGCLLKSEHVYLFAPKSKEEAANIVLPYLTRAYDALYGIVGVHTQYIVVVYNFPPGHADAFGGTSNCTLWYDDTNLNLDRQDEWNRYQVPHVSGYIEEMAHNFVAATRAQFGWEMVGWSIGTVASTAVASNPIFLDSLQQTRRGQAETYQRYREQGFTFPSDIEPNQVDRIHAYILWESEQKYGSSFWKDFFAEVRKEKQGLLEAAGDRDRRYQITVDCFDRLSGLGFKQRLTDDQISLVRDIKSLNPTEPGWNRKLQ